MRKAEILLVEDNEGDIALTQMAFEKVKMPHRIYVARDGEQAVNMLMKKDGQEDMPDFDLILLDLNLPRKNGNEVLADIKSDEKLKNIPIIMLSSSKHQRDIMRSYNYQVNSYIVKPNGMDEFVKIAQAIETCWFGSMRDSSVNSGVGTGARV